MNLYLVTPDKIEKTVIKLLSTIRNYKIIPNSYEDPFKNQLCTEWYIAPKSETKELRLIFSLPNMQENCWRMVISFF